MSRGGQHIAGTGGAPTTLTEPVVIRWGLIGLALTSPGLFLVVPLLAAFVKALEQGMTVYWSAISDPVALAARVRELLRLVQLAPLAGRYPSRLSGGQSQRAALALATHTTPNIISRE